MNKLIIISGPTASGKTKTSIELALKIQKVLNQKTAIVNFDSLLFYKEISIGTAKPTIDEQAGIRHELIDIVSISTPLNASDFILLAQNKIEELHRENYLVILVGGSAFYLRALLKGMYDAAKPNEELKNELALLYQQKGIDPFLDFLKENDPISLSNLHINDHYRLMRAVEFFKLTGQKISDQKQKLDTQLPYDFSANNHGWNVIHFYLDVDKNLHQQIIEMRTKKMLADGLQAEVSNLLAAGFSIDLKPLESIGYKEMVDYLAGKYPTIEDCFERIVISTRQLAKSQRTFFKKITPKIECNPLSDSEKIFIQAQRFLSID